MASRTAVGPFSRLAGKLRSLGSGFRRAPEVTQTADHDGLAESISVDGNTLVRDLPCLLLVVSREGTVLYSNQSIAGLSKAQSQGARVIDFVPQEHSALFERALGHVLLTGEPAGYEVADLAPDAPPALHILRFGPVLENGAVTAVTVLNIDVVND